MRRSAHDQEGGDNGTEIETECKVIPFEDLLVQVPVGEWMYTVGFWKGENEWFEGEITDIDVEEIQFEVFIHVIHRSCDIIIHYSLLT